MDFETEYKKFNIDEEAMKQLFSILDFEKNRMNEETLLITTSDKPENYQI